MAKVGNETRLIISLFKERAANRMKAVNGDGCKDWKQGVIRGLKDAEEIIAGIVTELERGHKL